MRHDLMMSIAKVQAMRKQCLEANQKIADAKEEMADDVQNKIEIYGAMARKGNEKAAYAYANLLKNRKMIGS